MEARILDIVQRFAAKDGVRYPGLDVVLFHFLEDEIRVIATDGHCLAWFTVKESHKQQLGESITVNLSDLETMSEKVFLMVYDNNLYISSGEKTITVKAAGNLKDFPDYEKLTTTVPPITIKHLIHPKYIQAAVFCLFKAIMLDPNKFPKNIRPIAMLKICNTGADGPKLSPPIRLTIGRAKTIKPIIKGTTKRIKTSNVF